MAYPAKGGDVGHAVVVWLMPANEDENKYSDELEDNDIAIIDLIFTIIIAIIISYFIKKNIIIILILLLIIAEIAHILFGVETKVINILKNIFHF